MPAAIADQVVDFFDALFRRIFSDAFRPQLTDVLRRKAVTRQVEEAADAASQSLIRFFRNQQLTEQEAADILEGMAPLNSLLELADISNPNITPEAIVEELLAQRLPIPVAVEQAEQASVFRVSLHSTVQVLMLVGPVMTEWQKLRFSSTFELPRRIVNRLNQISEQLGVLGQAGQAAADDRFELSYRDYLLQRFHRVEAGTVRMTTRLDVDLRELFVMPRVSPRKDELEAAMAEAATLMNLSAAREYFGEARLRPAREGEEEKESNITALEQVRNKPRNVLIGAPGSGKSTFLEWLQLKVAWPENEQDDFVMAGKQAIPLLLRVRQLDPCNLPQGAALIEKATASRDRATLMPAGWIERQMKAGRVLLMLDGLDETEPELRDDYLLPWLQQLCEQYPHCRYLVSSRPVGYPVGALHELKFVECDLLDFGEPEIVEYTRHWCTAIRLARSEPEDEARREGEADGKLIVESFKDHPYISNLARNPLMLSAICLVNYFEGGRLPRDRAKLYQLCVEGLLHHWDQRRGIRSDFTLEEKLRVCREVALAMQADDRAEYETDKVRQIFEQVLDNAERAAQLLEHIRYRTGLLLERRPGIFAFAHLTFQEYLAARAIHEGNRLRINTRRLVEEHADGRWKEVIALYCGLAPAAAAAEVIQLLIAQPDTEQLADVLAEAYLSTGAEMGKDTELRRRVLERIACAPSIGQSVLRRFPDDEVSPIAKRFVGCLPLKDLSQSYYWLRERPDRIEEETLLQRIKQWRELNPFQVCELNLLLHQFGSESALNAIGLEPEFYASPGPDFGHPNIKYFTQAEIATFGLRRTRLGKPSIDAVLMQVLRVISKSEGANVRASEGIAELLRKKDSFPRDVSAWPEFVSLVRQMVARFKEMPSPFGGLSHERRIKTISAWADKLEQAMAKSKARKRAAKTKTTKAVKQTSKKRTPRRKP